MACQPSSASKVLTSVMINMDQNTMLVLESVFDITRTLTTLTAHTTAETKAANAPTVMRLDVEGRSITRTPHKPMAMASHRCQPTFSRRMGTDSAVTISGPERNIEYASASDSTRIA